MDGCVSAQKAGRTLAATTFNCGQTIIVGRDTAHEVRLDIANPVRSSERWEIIDKALICEKWGGECSRKVTAAQ